MATAKTDQVTINMANLAPNNANIVQPEAMTANTNNVEVDGSHSNRKTAHRRHGSHGSSGSRSYNSGESDTDDHYHRRNHHGRRRSRSRSPSPRRNKRNIDAGLTPQTEKDIGSNINDVEPLLVTNIHRKPPQTELDDDSDDNVQQNEHIPGVDDGFFVDDRAGTPDGTVNKPHTNNNNNNNNHGASAPPHDNPPFPYSPGLNPNVIYDSSGNPQVVPDINVYQQKKTLAQGMMDLALLSANANQLRYVLESYLRHPYYYFSLVLVSISLVLQVAVGVGLIMNSRYNVKNQEQICRADKINNFTILGIFLVTTVNVFIAAFGVAESPPP